jgi:hypothetical protein
MTAKIAADAPMPITSVRIAFTVKAGVRRSDRQASRRVERISCGEVRFQQPYATTLTTVSVRRPPFCGISVPGPSA